MKLNLHPFHALRPQPQHIKNWSYRQVGDVNIEVDSDAVDFYSLIRPDENNHQQIRKRLHTFLKNRVLVKDVSPSLYCYRIKQNDAVFEGIIGLMDTKHVLDGTIVPHEGVVNKRVSMFKDYLKEVMLNTEAVLLGHTENAALTEIRKRFFCSRPFAEFERAGVTHSLWRIDHPTMIHQVQKALSDIKSLLIIDGHHRCYSSVQLAAEQAAYDKMLVCLVPDHQLKVDAFCRLFRDLNNHRPDHFIAQLSSTFNVARVNYYQKPMNSQSFAMYLERSWYKLQYKSIDREKAFDNLPTQVLYKHIAKPLLGIEDLHTDARIDYQYHENNKKGIEQAVDSKQYKLGIAHFPISLDLVKRCLSEGALLPPKSTYVFPKLLNGLLMYDFKAYDS